MHCLWRTAHFCPLAAMQGMKSEVFDKSTMHSNVVDVFLNRSKKLIETTHVTIAISSIFAMDQPHRCSYQGDFTHSRP
jgi:hypothetical protein